MTPEAMLQSKTGREAIRYACLTIRNEPGDKDAAFVSAGVTSIDERNCALDILRKPDEYADLIWRLLCATQASPQGAFVQAQPDDSVLIGLRGGRRYDVPAAVVPTLLLLLLDLTLKRLAGWAAIVERVYLPCKSASDRDAATHALAVVADQQPSTGALAVLAIRVACATTREELLEACRLDAQEYWR